MKASFFHAVLILSLAISCASYAQELNNVDAQENLTKIGGVDASYGVVRKFDNRYEGIEGSPFYFEYWSEGEIITESGQQLKNLRLKYNMYEDELIIDRQKAGFYYFPKHEVKAFTIKEKLLGENISFVKLNHPKKKESSQFYCILVEGEISLLEYIKVIFEKADFEGGYASGKRYDEFKIYPSFYYTEDFDQIPGKLKTTPGAISKIFPDYNAEIKKYINAHGLDCRNKNDLMKIFNYYATIK